VDSNLNSREDAMVKLNMLDSRQRVGSSFHLVKDSHSQSLLLRERPFIGVPSASTGQQPMALLSILERAVQGTSILRPTCSWYLTHLLGILSFLHAWHYLLSCLLACPLSSWQCSLVDSQFSWQLVMLQWHGTSL